MQRHLMAALLLAGMAAAAPGFGQTAPTTTPTDSTVVTPPPPPPPAPAKASRVYYGGSIGLSFWNDYTRISVEPLVGYKVTPRLSIGGKLRYEYLNDQRSTVDYDSHNYGASVFSRFRLVPPIYAHAEFAYMSYDYPSGRDEVPFLLLGGGYSKPIGKNAWLTAEVLFDVLQDSSSPYEDWEPLVSIGVGVGF